MYQGYYFLWQSIKTGKSDKNNISSVIRVIRVLIKEDKV